MKTRVLQIFCTPREADLLWRVCFQLRVAFNNLKVFHDLHPEDVKYILDIHVCLSGELVKWEDTSLSRHYFYDRFLSIKEGMTFCECSFTISEEDDILGPSSHRRSLAEKYPEADSFTFIDPDICFDPHLLKHIHAFGAQLEERHPNGWVLVPETVRLWDAGWDLLVNEEFLSSKLGFCTETDMWETLSNFYKTSRPRSIERSVSKDAPINHPSLGDVPYFHRMKLGWFTTVAPSLLAHVGFPEGCHYGYMDDHFMWALFKICLRWNLSPDGDRSVHIVIPQYKLVNSLSGTINHKPLLSVDYITLRRAREDLKKESEEICKNLLSTMESGSLYEKFPDNGITVSLGKV